MKSRASLFTSLILALSIPSHVAAHGFVYGVTIDGKAYPGNVPNVNDPAPSIVRLIDTVDPVKGADNVNLNCGQNAQFGTQVASANPGSVVSFAWKDGDVGNILNWPHDTGPMLTYMTNCGSTTCDKYNSSEALWFKIDQVGRLDNGSWAQVGIFYGGVATVTIPPTLAPGNYLIRHEIIALHIAETEYGAEFYPSCSQLTVGGDGTGVPSSDELVKLPGAYSDTDPGIWDPDAFDTNAVYVFPGPPIAKLAASSSDNPTAASSASASGTASVTASPSASSPAASATSSAGTCRLKRNITTTTLSRVPPVALVNPARHQYLSRIIRALNLRSTHH